MCSSKLPWKYFGFSDFGREGYKCHKSIYFSYSSCTRILPYFFPILHSFAINLGKDQENLLLHLNARFEAHGDIRTIVCNSRNKGQWGKELRETNFPFQEGGSFEVRLERAQEETKCVCACLATKEQLSPTFTLHMFDKNAHSRSQEFISILFQYI